MTEQPQINHALRDHVTSMVERVQLARAAA